MSSLHQRETPQSEDTGIQSPSESRMPVPTSPGEEDTRPQQATGLVISGPASGQRLHAFTLPDSTGQPVQLWQYLQRRNVMLFFHHGENCTACEAFLQALGAELETYRQEETAVIAIGSDGSAENRQVVAQPGHPFPCLNDPEGHVIAQQGLIPPSLIIADRWGEIWAAWQCGPDHQFPSQRDILQWLSFIEAQCPECTMIEWTD